MRLWFDRVVEAATAELVIKQLTLKFGVLSETVKNLVCSMSALELDGVGERVLTAQSLSEALGS